MNKTISYGIIAIGMSILFSSLSNNALAQMNVEGINQIDEDQIILCVNNSDGISNNGFTCHLRQQDDIDWYQEKDNGDFYDNDDSFDIRVVD